METSEDESSRTIDSPCGIVVMRYRLTETDCTLPLYISHPVLAFFPFAIKFLSPSHTVIEQDWTRFIHEARAASALDHSYTRTIREIDETPKIYCILR